MSGLYVGTVVAGVIAMLRTVVARLDLDLDWRYPFAAFAASAVSAWTAPDLFGVIVASFVAAFAAHMAATWGAAQ